MAIFIILLLLVLVTLVIAVNIHWTSPSLPVAASWGNTLCGADVRSNCQPVIKTAANWGSKGWKSDREP
jgi:hypothetical protein